MIIHQNERHDPLPPRTIVAIDTELYGMRKERLHWNNEGKFASLQYTWDGENIYVVTDEKKVSSAMELIKDATHIFHNAYFDIIHLRRWCDYPDRTNMYDTMLLEKLLFSGYYDTFGLADLAKRYLRIIVEKETREDFATKTKMTKEMLEYSALDASLTYKIFHKQKELIKDRRDVLKIWKLIDQPALYALVDLLDVTIDIETWDRIAEENEQRAIEIKKEAEERWGINIGSTMQIQKILNKRGFNISSSGEKVLHRLLKRKQKDDLIEKVLEYRYSSKRASTYGKKMHEEMFEDDGRARPGFKVSEAMTGRMSCVDGETLVDTITGKKKISEIKIGDLVLTHKNRYKRVLRTIVKGYDFMYNIRTIKGAELICTKKHRILTEKGWKQINDLKEKDNVYRWDNTKSPYLGSSKRNIYRCRSNHTGSIKKEQGWSSLNSSVYCFPQEKQKTFSGAEASKEKKLCQGWKCTILEENAKTKPTNNYSKRSNSQTKGGKSFGVSNIKSFRGCPTNVEKKSLLLWNTNKKPKTNFEFVRDRIFNPKEIRKYVSRHFRKSLYFKYSRNRRIFQDRVFSIRTNFRNNQDTTENRTKIFRPQSKKRLTSELLSLEYEQSRNVSKQKITGRRCFPYQTISVGKKDKKQGCSRLLFSKQKSISRSEWGCSQIRYNKRERQKKQKTYAGTRIFNSVCYQQRSREKCRPSYSKDTILSIDFCGTRLVWDIEVEKDHSYIAQGFINHNSSTWNLQNVPAEEKYRACIIAKPGHKILVTDYAAQEPRITAYESKDDLLVKMTQIKGESIHVSVGRELFDDPKLDKKDKRYKAAKGLNLGLQYGLTAVGLQRDLNDKKEEDEPPVSREDAQGLLNMYFAKFPKVKEWSNRQRNSVRNPGYVETKLGRRCWLNPYNWQSGNNALNSPIQGGAADITKYALSEIRKHSYKRWGEWYCFGVVHDEIDFSVPIEIFEEHKNMVESIMVKCAEQIYKGITFEVESKWGDNWACKGDEE